MKSRHNFYFFVKVEPENIILKNWLEQKEKFTENLYISRKRPTKDSVHDLRVAVKKMRSYLRLKEHLAGEKWKESFIKIITLFKSFGRLRDHDMSLILLRLNERKQHLSFPFFKEYLSVNRSLSRKWAKQAAINFNGDGLSSFEQQFNLGLNNSEIYEKIIHLSRLKIKKVKSLSKHVEKNTHEIRKQLKDVYYWLKICPKEMAESFINIKDLDRMLNYLGRWQDHFIFRNKIKQYIKDLPKKNDERLLLKILDKNLINAQDEILDKAVKKWKEIEVKRRVIKISVNTTGTSLIKYDSELG